MAGLHLNFNFGGVQQMQRTLLGVSAALADLRPAWGEVAQYMRGASARLFASEGATGRHGRWADYSKEPRYERIKAKYAGNARPILLWGSMATSRLAPSLIQKGHPFAVDRATASGLVWGTAVPYADRLAAGGPTPFGETAPGRLAIDLGDRDVREIVRIVQRHLVRPIEQEAA